MLKKLLIVLAVLVVLVGVAIGLSIAFVDSIAKAAVERGATYVLGVETTIDSMDLRLRRGEADVATLRVANPDGYDAPHFVLLGGGAVKLDAESLSTDAVRLPYIRLADLDVHLQKREGKANYDAILENLKRFESDAPPSGDEPAEAEATKKRVIVDELLIEAVTVHVDLLPVGGQATVLDVPIDRIRMEGIGADETDPVAIGDLAGIVVKAVLGAVVEKAGDILPEDFITDLEAGLAQLESLGDMGVEAVAELGAGAEEAIRGAIESAEGGLGEVGEAAGGAAKEAERAIGEIGRRLGGGGGGGGGGGDGDG